MVKIKTFVEVANNVNKVGEGLYLSYNISINMAFAGFLPRHLGVLLVYQFYFHIQR